MTTHDRTKHTYDAEEAADLLKVARSTVLELAESGELPGAKIGRAWVFIADDLIEWLRGKTAAQVKSRRSAATTTEPAVRKGGGRRVAPPSLEAYS